MKRNRIVAGVVVALAGLWIGTAATVQAAVKTEPVEYKQGGTVLKGFLAYDDDATGKLPGVLVVHEWWGLNDYAKKRARMLAEEGYVAFALDMYGEGKTTEHPSEAGEWAQAVGQNQELASQRFNAAYELLKKNERVDGDKIAAIGYCFGGSVVLSMALAGVDLDAVVSFHGGLPQEKPSGDIKASILVCHGALDAMTTQEQINTFKNHLAESGCDWELNIYGNAKHSFTNPGADERGIPQLGYNKKADKRSWQAMLMFLDGAFQ
jgi:dienelactone hydrolase